MDMIALPLRKHVKSHAFKPKGHNVVVKDRTVVFNRLIYEHNVYFLR